MAHLHPKSSQRCSSGFSLTEILVGTVVLALAVAMGATMNGVASSNLRSNSAINQRDAAADSDVEAIRSLAETYTWCSGTGAFAASGPSCSTTDPSNREYYSPTTPPAGSSAMDAFEAACSNGTLNNALIATIDRRQNPPGLTRTVEAEPANRIRISYNSPANDLKSPVFHSVVLTPTVAAWCS